MKRNIFASMMCVALSVAASHAQALGTDQFAEFLKSTGSASGEFVQVTQDRNGQNVGQQMSGTFLFQRPGKFVWSYEKPYKQVAYSDGKTVSLWDPDLRQVTVKDMAGAIPSSPASILFGNNDFSRDFSVSNGKSENGIEWIEAVPKAREASFQRFRIGFSGALPSELEILDNFGQTIRLKFSSLRKNPQTQSEQFVFIPPKGTEILRQ